MQLYVYGCEDGKPKLLEYLETNPDPYHHALVLWLLIGDESNDTEEAFRKILAKVTDDPKNPFSPNLEWGYVNQPTIPLFMRTLAFEKKEDIHRIAGMTLTVDHAEPLTCLVEDPVPLGEVAFMQGKHKDFLSAARIFLSCQETDPFKRDVIDKRLALKAYWEGYDRAPKGTYDFQREGYGRRDRDWYHKFKTFKIPVYEAAEACYHGSFSHYLMKWMPQPMDEKAAYEGLIQGTGWDYSPLEYISRETMVEEFDTRKASETVKRPKLFLAMHGTTTKAWQAQQDVFPDFRIKRPYAFSHTEEGGAGGAINGLIEIRPELVNGRLRLYVGNPQSVYYKATAIIDWKEGRKERYEHYKYVADNGREIISRIRLRKGFQEIELEEVGRTNDGVFIFEAQGNHDALSNLSVEVFLEFFEKNSEFSVNLFDGEYARFLTLGKILLKQSAEKNSTEYAALCKYYGKFQKAAETYRALLKAEPKNVDLYFDFGDMYLNSGFYKQAAKISEQAVKALPKEADLWSSLAYARYLNDDYRKASEAYATVVSLDPQDVPSLRYQGDCLLLAGDKDTALACYRKLPKEDAPLMDIAMLWLTARLNGQEGAEELEELKSVWEKSENSQSKNFVGVLTAWMRDTDILAKASAKSDLCSIYTGIGLRSLLRGKKENAKKAFKTAVSMKIPNLFEYKISRMQLKEMQ